MSNELDDPVVQAQINERQALRDALKDLADTATEAEFRAAVEAAYGQCWSTDQFTEDFEMLEFMAPWVLVRRKSDGVRGTLKFWHRPRLYFFFEEE